MTTRRPASRRIDPRSARALALVLAAAALCAPLAAWGEFQKASDVHAAALADHAALQSTARRLLDLTATPTSPLGAPVSGFSRAPSADLVARLRAVMAEAGVPASALRDARQIEPVALRGSDDLARLSGSATVAALSPADAARLLAGWRAAEPAWTVRSIALRASQQPRGAASPVASGGRAAVQDLFDLDVQFEAVAPASPSNRSAARPTPPEAPR